EARDRVAAEQTRRRARFPDQALVDLGAGLDLLVRIDPDAGHDHALRADRDLVADGDAFVDPHVRADVTRAPDDRSLDERAAADVRGRVDDRSRDPRALAQGDAVRQHRVGADA